MPISFRSDRFAGDPLLEQILNDPDTGNLKLEVGSPPSDSIRTVQEVLFELGWGMPPSVARARFADGDYGKMTEAVVRAYKTRRRLVFPPGTPTGVIDGATGPRTLLALDLDLHVLEQGEPIVQAKALEVQQLLRSVDPPDDLGCAEGPTRVLPISSDGPSPGVVCLFDNGFLDEDGVRSAIYWEFVPDEPPLEAHALRGPILAAYLLEGGPEGGVPQQQGPPRSAPLGMPIADQFPLAGDPEQPGEPGCQFRNGRLETDASGGVVVIFNSP